MKIVLFALSRNRPAYTGSYFKIEGDNEIDATLKWNTSCSIRGSANRNNSRIKISAGRLAYINARRKPGKSI
jgi:hypothetical protein